MLSDSYGNMLLFGNGGHISSSWASEISCIILHLSGSSRVLPFLVSRLYSENFILPIIWYSKVPVWPKWRCDTLCPSRRQRALEIGLQKYDEGA